MSNYSVATVWVSPVSSSYSTTSQSILRWLVDRWLIGWWSTDSQWPVHCQWLTQWWAFGSALPYFFSHRSMYSSLRWCRRAKYSGYCALSSGCQVSNNQSGTWGSRPYAMPPGEFGNLNGCGCRFWNSSSSPDSNNCFAFTMFFSSLFWSKRARSTTAW